MGKNNKKRRIRSSSQDSAGAAASSSTHNNNSQKKNDDHQNKKKDSNQSLKSHQPHSHSKNAKKTIKNPLFDKQQAFLNQLSDVERNEFFSSDITPERRAELWMQQADLGESLVNDYAWATPNDTAIRICKEFGPLIEIGCGANAYWCQVLKASGIDIIGHDSNAQAGGKITNMEDEKSSNNNQKKSKTKKKKEKESPSKVENVLQKVLNDNPNRNLFLCYPDDDDEEEENDAVMFNDEGVDDINPPALSMAAQCLEHYTGQYIIHVGELFLDANYSLDQAPWGRSSSPEFQQRLAVEFHCLLKVGLPNWLHVRDSISVWKRSEQTSIVFGGDDDDDDDDSNEADDEDDIDEVVYRHIPVEERLPMNVAAPCLAHLLLPPNTTTKGSKDAVAAGPTKKGEQVTSSKKKSGPPIAKPAPSKQEDDDDDDDDDDSSADNKEEPDEQDEKPPTKKQKKKGRLNLGVSQVVQKNIKKVFNNMGGKSSTPW
jgi:hypothetical protein